MSLQDFASATNQWITDHKELVTVLAVPAITFFVTRLLNASSERRAVQERVLERELARRIKVAEFRQVWINELREDLAELASRSVNLETAGSDGIKAINRRLASIRLRLNTNESSANELLEIINKIFQSKSDPHGSFQTDLVKHGQAYLKTEWDRLKRELAEVDGMEKQLQ